LDLKRESWFGTHKTTIINAEDQEEWYESVRKDHTKLILFAYINEFSERAIGLYKLSNIDWISRSADTAHDVFKYRRGEGYGHKVLEAGVDFSFEILNLHRLNTEVLENNLASKRSHELIGWSLEGMRKNAVYKNGIYLNSAIFGLLREDWLSSERVRSYNGVCNYSYTPKDEKRA
jgi:RimJ/RimL family protein N-acetyltransferase